MDDIVTFKTCTKCHKEKAFSEFFKHKLGKNGLNPSCKKCCNARIVKWRSTPSVKERRQIINQIIDKAYREANRDKTRARAKAYQEKQPDRTSANRLVTNRISQGRIVPEPCVVCKKLHDIDRKADAHHSDYNKPLDIQWLCRTHHRTWHKIFLPIEKGE